MQKFPDQETRNAMTSHEAVRLHWIWMRRDRRHSRASCWCCCTTCNFSVVMVYMNDAAAALVSVEQCWPFRYHDAAMPRHPHIAQIPRQRVSS